MPRVLIAEADRALAQRYGRELQKRGFEVLIAYDAAECVRCLEAFLPEVLVFDPGLPGESVFLRLADPAFPGRSAVVLCSHSLFESEPIPVARLVSLVCRIVNVTGCGESAVPPARRAKKDNPRAARLAFTGVAASLLALLWAAGGALLLLATAVPVAAACGVYLAVFGWRLQADRPSEPPLRAVTSPFSANGKTGPLPRPFR